MVAIKPIMPQIIAAHCKLQQQQQQLLVGERIVCGNFSCVIRSTRPSVEFDIASPAALLHRLLDVEMIFCFASCLRMLVCVCLLM